MRAKGIAFAGTMLVVVSFTAATAAFSPSKPTGVDRKIASAVVRQVDRVAEIARAQGSSRARIAAANLDNPLVTTSPAGEFHVYLRVRDASPAVQAEVAALGARIERVATDLGLIECWIMPDKVRAVAGHAAVIAVKPIERPELRVGSAMTEGDSIIGANRIRSLDYDGRGVRVGVISDDVDHLSDAQSSGDLPSVTVLNKHWMELETEDEGTAMLEIIHDIAPGASLYFSNGVESSVRMRDAMVELANAGCDIIVDDVGWRDQPLFFEDGFLSNTVDYLAAQGVVYVSAAGNSALHHYEGDYVRTSAHNRWHAWDGVNDSTMWIEVKPGSTLSVLLEWNDRYGTAGNDYDLYLFSSETLIESNRIARSIDAQAVTREPREALVYTNNIGAKQIVYLAVYLFQGVPSRLGILLKNEDRFEYPVTSGSIWGHPSARGAIAVAAINANVPNHDVVASISSRGPRTIYHPVQETRAKPDLAGIDCVSVSGAGGWPPFSPGFFPGTSAAAPHVAAVAALIIDESLG